MKRKKKGGEGVNVGKGKAKRKKMEQKREGTECQAHTCINFRHSARSITRSMRLAGIHGDLRALLQETVRERAVRSGRSD